MMSKRQVVLEALAFRPAAYVPWAWKMTIPCARRVGEYLGGPGFATRQGGSCRSPTLRRGEEEIESFIDSHFLNIRTPVRRYETVGDGLVRDTYGVTWDRSVDPDIGTPVDWPIREEADLGRYRFPVADDPKLYEFIAPQLERNKGLFRRFSIGYTLYERAWALRGMTQLLMDMIERPAFVDDLLDAIVEHVLEQVRQGLRYDFDAFYFGDDYGMQTGLIMGIKLWRRFFKPRLARIFAPVRGAGKSVFLHSCGQISSILDDLFEIGLNGLDPFQPEVMDVGRVMEQYRGRLAFHGGMGIQKVLPFGTPQDVRSETRRLIAMGMNGGYIFAPSHAVPGDVPPENLVAMMEVLKGQSGYLESKFTREGMAQ